MVGTGAWHPSGAFARRSAARPRSTVAHEQTQVRATVPPVDEKRCPKCGEVKPLDQFNVDHAKPDGRQGYCRECNRIYGDGYRAGRARES